MKIVYTPAKEEVVQKPESFRACTEKFTFETVGSHFYLANEADMAYENRIRVPIDTLLAFVEAYNNRGK